METLLRDRFESDVGYSLGIIKQCDKRPNKNFLQLKRRDVCGKEIGRKQFTLTAENYPIKYEFYNCCSDECLRVVLQSEGIISCNNEITPNMKKQRKAKTTHILAVISLILASSSLIITLARLLLLLR